MDSLRADYTCRQDGSWQEWREKKCARKRGLSGAGRLLLIGRAPHQGRRWLSPSASFDRPNDFDRKVKACRYRGDEGGRCDHCAKLIALELNTTGTPGTPSPETGVSLMPTQFG